MTVGHLFADFIASKPKVKLKNREKILALEVENDGEK